MIGKQLSFSVRVDPLNTPINGMIAVVSNGWHKVDDGPLIGKGWITKGGVVGPESLNWEGSPTAKSVPVSEIRISVYLATPVHGGSDGNWQGDIYVDDIGWR